MRIYAGKIVQIRVRSSKVALKVLEDNNDSYWIELRGKKAIERSGYLKEGDKVVIEAISRTSAKNENTIKIAKTIRKWGN